MWMSSFIAARQLLDTVKVIAARYELARAIVDDTFDWEREALMVKGFTKIVDDDSSDHDGTVFCHPSLMRDGKHELFEGPIDACRAIDPEKYPFSISEVMDAARELLPKVLVRSHWHQPGDRWPGTDFLAMSEDTPNARLRGVMNAEGQVIEARIEQRLPSFQWETLVASYETDNRVSLRTFASLLALR
jgi:hypothetical protein